MRMTEGGGLPAKGAIVARERLSLCDQLHLAFVDHALLRVWWHNTEEIAPGVWRSNQPGRKRVQRWKKMGIRSVVSLRGDLGSPHGKIERAACAESGLQYSCTWLSGTRAPGREALLELVELFRTVERPFIMHCKSGADRTGLASVLYLMVIEGVPLEQARKQLSFRFLHVSASAAGVLGHMLDLYARRQAKSAIGIEEWIATEYDAQELTRSFARLRDR